MGLQRPVSSSPEKGVMFVLSVCIGRGSLTPEPRLGGGLVRGWQVTAEATAHEACGCIPSFRIRELSGSVEGGDIS